MINSLTGNIKVSRIENFINCLFFLVLKHRKTKNLCKTRGSMCRNRIFDVYIILGLMLQVCILLTTVMLRFQKFLHRFAGKINAFANITFTKKWDAFFTCICSNVFFPTPHSEGKYTLNNFFCSQFLPTDIFIVDSYE